MRSKSFFRNSQPANIAGTIVLFNKKTQTLHRVSHEKHRALAGKKPEAKPKSKFGGFLSFFFTDYAR